MTTRNRRLLVVAVVGIVLLFAGRWTVGVLAERWWAATLSPAAATFVTHWRLLGLALDAGAMVVSSLWFALQALLVARAIASVQVTRRFGNLQLREAVPVRLLVAGAIVTGVLLGLVTGVGARAWRAPLMLAWQGVTYGAHDPLLGEDLGLFVARLPLYDLMQHFAAMLVFLGLAFAALMYYAIGAIRRQDGEIVVHPLARRHLGGLLALLAATLSAGYFLAPWHLAGAGGPALSIAASFTRIRTAQIMSGVALGVAMLGLLWALRPRHSVIAAAWGVMALGALAEQVVVPALTEASMPPPTRDAEVRRLDGVAWGIRRGDLGSARDSVPAVTALWDETILARYVERGGGALLAATPSMIAVNQRPTPVWLVATPSSNDSTSIDVLAIADGATAPGGSPLTLSQSGDTVSPRPSWHTLANPLLRPDAAAWRPVAGAVLADGTLRRIVLAWAEQAPGMLREARERAVDWHLDPVGRAAALLPMATWLPAELVLLDDRPTWVVSGLLAIGEFPLATRAHWEGALVAGVVPSFIATMDAANGELHIHLDPAADSLAAAWGHIVGPLVEPASTIPAGLLAALPYPTAWFEAQLEVLEAPVWGIGRRPERSVAGPPARSVVVWPTAGNPGRQLAFEDTERRVVSAVVTGSRIRGLPDVQITRTEPNGPKVQNARELEWTWSRGSELQHLRDSSRAAGDSVDTGPVRYQVGPGGTAAWQMVEALPQRGEPTLLWIAAAFGDRLGGGRTQGDAWRSVRSPLGGPSTPTGPDDSGIVLEARRLMLRADSALTRGDLTAFGHWFEELKRILRPAPH